VPDCPVCSKPMVQREAKKGKNAGNKFWGCTQYPKCRGVLDTEEVVEEVAEEAVDTEPTCPKCDGDMVKRVSKKGKNAGNEFWGCQNFPKCRGVVSIENIVESE
jgi:ssDNA-binding Zn-finger/Zn-ribbon topoisomerase 1